jgi:hypothetical protein
MRVFFDNGAWSSWRSCQSQQASATPLATARYSGDDVLALGGSGDEIVVEEHSVARGGPTCIWVTRPVCIRVDRQPGGGGAASQVEAPGDHAYEDKSAGWRRRCRSG